MNKHLKALGSLLVSVLIFTGGIVFGHTNSVVATCNQVSHQFFPIVSLDTAPNVDTLHRLRVLYTNSCIKDNLLVNPIYGVIDALQEADKAQ